MTALTAKLKPFTTHEAMCAQLEVIAEHLIRNFESSLRHLEFSDHREVDANGDQEIEAVIEHLCTAWKAEHCEAGACKAFVFVNHQWVVKLGQNACDEAIAYDMIADEGFRHLIVPTVALGEYGCLQVKAILPTDYCNLHNLNWEDFWYSKSLVEQRAQFDEFNDDTHMENCGFIDDILYMIDFAGADILPTPAYNESE